ncbi:Zn-dependent hydrolase [Leptospira wolffii]|uniref:MBL fold metallo-hydrolase n=1 Tax=Leptospira wolffii TaxID=409998 RepID=UPI001083B62D|nr:MBL fold metallo-hydrolase [Leptospira wolffii]TGK56207.1 Zn-dependent hydrolase [Leptospira wolffii]TGK72254.1 Zn-dependent hydrolase [Leptospira wolffii]TGK72840.1 Zn-dependent hydrolase [Leptospira wolffii]TGL27831.1 Zn-dependent hydrolase [Leptospira wolffii]
MIFFSRIFLLWIILSSFYCFPLDPDRIKSPSYHDGRYHNLDPDEELQGKSPIDILRWKLWGPKDPPAVEGLTNELPLLFERTAKDLIAPEGKVRVVWLGHATVWISSTQNGKTINLITDPIFEAPILVDRLIKLPISKESLPRVDFVLVSHAHRDHLDRDTLRFLRAKNPDLQLLLPSGMKQFAEEEELGVTVTQELGQITSREGVKIIFLPAHHWSRMGLRDTNQYFWGSYAIESQGRMVYFAGDTGYSSHFKDISKRLGKPVDLALLPIGAYKPRWFMKYAHIGPTEALLASKDLGAKSFAPIHWGTFPLGDDLPQEPMLDLKQRLSFPETPDLKGIHPLYTGISWGVHEGVRILPWGIGTGIDL